MSLLGLALWIQGAAQKGFLKRGLDAVGLCVNMRDEQTNHTVVAFDPPQSAALYIRAEASGGSKERGCCAIKTSTRAHQH